VWIKASSVVADGSLFPAHDFGRVNLIRDASNSGPDGTMSQSTEDNQPTLRHTGLNNLPTLAFDGLDDFMTGPTDILHSNTNGLSIFVVGKSTVANGQQTFVGKYDRINNEREWRLQNDDVIVTEEATSLGLNEPAEYTEAQDDFRLLSGIWTPGEVLQSYVDGSIGNTASNPPVSTITTTSEPVLLGSTTDSPSSFFLTGEIAEVIVYNRALSDTERQSVETHLNTKYNLY
jgi:hypothetical protein